MLISFARWLLFSLLFFISGPLIASEQALRNSVALGALVFADNCIKCHQIDGYGEEELYPSLHNPALLANRTLLIQTVLHGRLDDEFSADGTEQRLMPGLDFLSNKEIVALIAFISNSWGSEVLVVTDQQVEEAR